VSENAEQVIAGRIRARTGSSYIGMAMKDMHTLTSLLLLNQLQHHTLWLLGGYVILLQAVKESRWCEILSRKIIEHVSFSFLAFYETGFCVASKYSELCFGSSKVSKSNLKW